MKEFINLKNAKKITIDGNVKQFLKSVNIYTVNIELLDIKNKFTVKGNSNSLNIGINNDKCSTLKEIERVSKSLLVNIKMIKENNF